MRLLILKFIALIGIFLIVGCSAEATSESLKRNQEARVLLNSIQQDLAAVREIGRFDIRQGRQLVLSDVLDRIDALDDVSESLERLREDYADVQWVEGAEVEALANR